MYICYIAQDKSDTLDSTLKERVERMARIADRMFVCVVRNDTSSTLENLPNHAEVVFIDAHRFPFLTTRRVKKACRAFLSDTKEHVSLIADDCFFSGVSARALGKAYGRAYNLFVHNELSCEKGEGKKTARILSEARLIVVPSMRVKKACDICADRDLSAIVAIVPPPVFAADFSNEKPQVYDSRHPVFFLDATHMYERDILSAFSAFAPVARRYPNALLTVSGCATIRAKTESFIHHASLERHIQCLPPLSDSETALHIAHADLTLYTPFRAGLGSGLVHALLLGSPVLTTDVGVVGSLVTADDALICPPGDSECLTKRMLLLLDNPAILQSLRESAAKTKEKFPRTVSEPDRYDLRMKDLLE